MKMEHRQRKWGWRRGRKAKNKKKKKKRRYIKLLEVTRFQKIDNILKSNLELRCKFTL